MFSDKIRSLPVREWPDADRAAWELACRPKKRLIRGGPASHLDEVTRDDYQRRYGYFLDHLLRTGRFARTGAPAALVTAETITPFITELQGRVRSVTTAHTVHKVRRTAELIAAEIDFGWLREIEKDLELVARPMDKSNRVVLTQRLVEAGLALFRQAELSLALSPLQAALLARNGLMMALLALCPIRSANFATLTIGDTFQKHRDTWWIVLRKTKSRRRDNRPLPTYLVPRVESYLANYRLQLLGGSDRFSALEARPTKKLWVSRHGRPLSTAQVARTIREMTLSTVGVAITPHLFRSCAATTAAMYAPRMPHLASAILDHVDPRTTESSYNCATSLAAGLLLTSIVHTLR